MPDFHEWEQQVQRSVEEIRRNGQQLAEAVEAIRGRGEVQGVRVELDARGDITALQIAPGAMRWTSAQMTTALLDCHRRARSEVRSKLDRLIDSADPRITGRMDQTVVATSDVDAEPRSMTDAELSAADDAYFEQRNRYGGWTSG